METKNNGNEEFFAELESWKLEMIKDIDLITDGLRIQGEPGKAHLLKFYRGLSYKILKWKQFVHETNASDLSK